jgi:hypothetical protein
MYWHKLQERSQPDKYNKYKTYHRIHAWQHKGLIQRNAKLPKH